MIHGAEFGLPLPLALIPSEGFTRIEPGHRHKWGKGHHLCEFGMDEGVIMLSPADGDQSQKNTSAPL